MKHRAMFFMPLIASLLISCGNNRPSESSFTPSDESSEIPSETEESEESSETESDSEEANPIAAPQLKLNEEKDGLVWDEVEDAVGYEVKVNSDDPIQAYDYTFEEKAGDYSVSVRSLAANPINNSEYSEPFEYKAVKTVLGSASYINGQIETTGLVGLGLVYTINGGEEIHVDQPNFIPDGFGIYTVSAAGGFDEETNTFYFDGGSSYNVLVCPQANDEYIIEDGSDEDNTYLQSNYRVYKFDSGWKDSTATLELSNENGQFSDGKCVQLDHYKHSAWFKYVKDFKIDASYDVLTTYVKGNGESKIGFYFEIGKETKIGNFDLTGVYMNYTIDAAPAYWVKHEISLNDSGWVVDYGGTKKSTAEVLSLLRLGGLDINSVAELLPLFTEFSFRVYCNADAAWSRAYAWVDETKLLNTHADTSEETMIEDASLETYYSYRLSNNQHGTIKFNNGGTTAQMNLISADNSSSEVLGLSVGLSKHTLTLEHQDADETKEFTMVFDSIDAGKTFKYVSGQGRIANMFMGVSLDAIHMYEDFESYTETGKGYDKSNPDIENVSGLRGAYYSDWWSGQEADSSPVGGTKWNLMASNDYLDFSPDGGIDGSKAAKVKSSGNTMRHINRELAYAGINGLHATAIGKFTTFSFMAKGAAERNVSLQVYCYYADSITPSTQQSNRSGNDSITIQQNSDWKEYTVKLNSSKTYYGFSIVAMGTAGTTGYFYIDNICFYNGESPFAM